MSAQPVSIVYVTNRAEPHFDWFADSLALQLSGDEVEVIFVDGHHAPERAGGLEEIVAGRFPMRHVPPKPTPYSGPHRLTSRDYSTISNARNTGIVYSHAPYIVFVDDCCLLAEGFWDEVRVAASLGIVLAGCYENRLDLSVEDGRAIGGRPQQDRDSRWELADSRALVQIAGSQSFGCALGVPRESLVALNGFDELCDPIGGEDSQLGVRLEWSGARIFLSRRMLVIKDANRHRGDSVVRLDRSFAPGEPLDQRRYMECLGEFGVSERTIADGRLDCSHLCLDILYGTRSARALGNPYELALLTETELAAGAQSFPDRYWATGEPISSL